MKATSGSMKRTPFLYLALGFIAGTICSRNAEPMSNPAKGAVVLGIVLVTWFALRAGKRGQAEAVAIATATATAIASSNAEANAKAVATQAVQIVLQTGALDGNRHSAILHDSREEALEAAHDYIESLDFSQDFSQDLAHDSR